MRVYFCSIVEAGESSPALHCVCEFETTPTGSLSEQIAQIEAKFTQILEGDPKQPPITVIRSQGEDHDVIASEIRSDSGREPRRLRWILESLAAQVERGIQKRKVFRR